MLVFKAVKVPYHRPRPDQWDWSLSGNLHVICPNHHLERNLAGSLKQSIPSTSIYYSLRLVDSGLEDVKDTRTAFLDLSRRQTIFIWSNHVCTTSPQSRFHFIQSLHGVPSLFIRFSFE